MILDVKKQNDIRNEIQQKAVLLSESNDKILLQFATGSGKTAAALKIVENCINNGDKRSWHIVVWESKHIKNWTDDIQKHNMQHILPYVHIYCYASLKSQAFSNVHYICDEGHHMFGDTYWEILQEHIHNRLVVLTATMPAEKLKVLKATYPTLARYSITLSDAIKKGLLPAPNIYIVPVGFDNIAYDHEIVIQKGGKAMISKTPVINCKYGQHWQYLRGAKVVNLCISCTAAQKLEHLNGQVEYQKTLFIKNKQEFQKIRWMAAGRDRKTFIAEAKTPAAKRLDTELKKLKQRKIVFCGSVDQAIALGDSNNTIHSRITGKQSQQIVDNFNALTIDNLYTNRMVREGMNLKDIHMAIIVQLDKESLSFLQMLGRSLRANNPHVFVLVAHGTQDDKYFNSATLGIDIELFKPFVSFFEQFKNGNTNMA